MTAQKNNLYEWKISNATAPFFPSFCVCVCTHAHVWGGGGGACFLFVTEKNCQDTWKMHSTENFKGVNQENKWLTPVELYTMLYSLISSEFFIVNVITVTDHLYWSAKQWYGLAYNYLESFLESWSKLGNERYSLYCSEQCSEELLKLFKTWRQLSK